jgi:hypothetical protein
MSGELPMRSDASEATIDELRCDERGGMFRLPGITIRPDQVLRIHGYRDPAQTRPLIRETAELIAKRAENLLVPEVYYRRLDVLSLDGADLVLEGGIALQSEAFTRYLPGATQVVVAISTMGRALDLDTAMHSERGDLLEALFLETCGWLGINAVTARFTGRLHQWARQEGYDVTSRLGPGYGYKVNGRIVYWPMEQQRQLFAGFDESELPIKLSDACVMLPKMSRSGMFGIIPKK